MKINHMPQRVRKDNRWTNISACSNKSNFPAALRFHVICIDQSNFEFSNKGKDEL